MKNRCALSLNLLFLFILLFGIVYDARSAQNPEEAKNELERMGVKYSEDVFFEKVKAGDVKAVKLFLERGMPTDVREKTEGGDTALQLQLIKDMGK